MLATTSVHIGPEPARQESGSSDARVGYEDGSSQPTPASAGPSIEQLEHAITILLSSIKHYLLTGAPQEIVAAATTYAETIRDASQTARLQAEAQEKPPTVMLGYDVKYEALREEEPLDPEDLIAYTVDVEEDDPI